jgi:hypothetical protein
MVVMSTPSNKLKIPLPVGTENFTRANYINILESIDTHNHDNGKVYSATGTGTGIVITTINGTCILADGYSFTFVAPAANGGAATTIKVDSNTAKSVYKPNTTNAPTFVSGKAYTVWYSATSDCFFFIASTEGTAVAAHVLAGDSFSNDNDTGLTGTMPNNGALGGSLAINGTYTIPAGYTSGGTVTQSITTKSAATYTPSASVQTIASGQYLSGAQTISAVTVPVAKVLNDTTIAGQTGTITQKSAQTYTPTTTDQTITAGQYLSGVQTIKGDADLIAPNILNTANIFGVQGSAINGAGMKKVASGTVTNTNDQLSFTQSYYGNVINLYYLTVSGLTFTPTYILITSVVSGIDPTVYKADRVMYYTSIYAPFTNGVHGIELYGNAVVTSTGFTLPVNSAPYSYSWIAIE